MVEANHNSDNKNTARKNMEEKSKDYDKEGNNKEKLKEKRDAWIAYKIAFKAWKTAKEDLKSVKNSGDSSLIAAKQLIVIAAKIVKEDTFEKYKDALRKGTR